MAGVKLRQDVLTGMKRAGAVLFLSWMVVGCYHERSPYSAAEETNNPPSTQPAFTNPVPTPVSDRTNSSSQPGSAEITKTNVPPVSR
jgi:hypothetical protein